LISPPPHHDIYSIEDLAQLIFDLKNDLIKKFKDGTFDKNNLPIFFELIEVITADKKLSIPWEKL